MSTVPQFNQPDFIQPNQNSQTPMSFFYINDNGVYSDKIIIKQSPIIPLTGNVGAILLVKDRNGKRESHLFERWKAWDRYNDGIAFANSRQDVKNFLWNGIDNQEIFVLFNSNALEVGKVEFNISLRDASSSTGDGKYYGFEVDKNNKVTIIDTWNAFPSSVATFTIYKIEDLNLALHGINPAHVPSDTRFALRITIHDIQYATSQITISSYFKDSADVEAAYSSISISRATGGCLDITNAYLTKNEGDFCKEYVELVNNSALIGGNYYNDAISNKNRIPASLYVPPSKLPPGQLGLIGGGDANNKLILFMCDRSEHAYNILYSLAWMMIGTCDHLNDGNAISQKWLSVGYNWSQDHVNLQVADGKYYPYPYTSSGLFKSGVHKVKVYGRFADGWRFLMGNATSEVTSPTILGGALLPRSSYANLAIEICSADSEWWKTFALDVSQNSYSVSGSDAIVYTHASNNVKTYPAPISIELDQRVKGAISASNSHEPLYGPNFYSHKFSFAISEPGVYVIFFNETLNFRGFVLCPDMISITDCSSKETEVKIEAPGIYTFHYELTYENTGGNYEFSISKKELVP